jgi:glycyl-tRNA synthetase beta chain
MADFLLEIGCEEIPARMIDGAREELASRVGKLFISEGLFETAALDAPGDQVELFSTPRRLSIAVRNVRSNQIDIDEQIIGPATKVAFKDGKPTAAAEAFAKKVGLPLSAIKTISNPKGEYLHAAVTKKGRSTNQVLAETLPKEIASLYWAKSMFWRAGAPERFVRPIRWIVAMLDDQVIPFEFAGVKSGTTSQGHRILGREVKLARAADYRGALEKAFVSVDSPEREKRVQAALEAETSSIKGARCRADSDLLNTVVNLTEWPSVILGSFDKSYLDLPEEVLVTVMRDHQKYFAVEDASGRLAPHFLAVLNTDGDKDGIIRHGNERVLRARFNDARFFWQADQKVTLQDRVTMLHAVTFQKDLGNYHLKSQRVASLADKLAADLANSGTKIDRDALHKAAWLCKTDLTTELVKEFTELQGIIGGLYAKAQGHPQAVADAIYGHYKPESMEDSCPATVEGAVLAVADKADTIAGMFALGQIPTGSKDPLALRRQANGIFKVLAEHKLSLSTKRMMVDAANGYKSSTGKVQEFFGKPVGDQVEEWASGFFRERLEFYLKDVRGFAYDVVNAVLAAGADNVVDAVARAEAVTAVRGSEDFAAISVSFKRMKNILRQAATEKKQIAPDFEPALLLEPAEQALAGSAPHVAGTADRYREQGKFREALSEISTLRPAIDGFFDKVMVMDQDERVRANRLALLQKLLNDFSKVADFSEIVTEKK